MDFAEFKHSKWQRYGATVSVVVLTAFFAPLAVLGIWFLTVSLSQPESESIEDHIVHALGVCVMVWMLVWLLQQVRHRHAYRHKYIVHAQGIDVESPELQQHVRWDQFESAEYYSLFYLVRLKSRLLQKPVVIFLTTENPEATAKSEFTQDLIETQMGSRYRKRWLP